MHVLQVDMPVFFYIDPDYVRDPFLQARQCFGSKFI
jgi:cytochrome c oxidase assembly protein Cox11